MRAPAKPAQLTFEFKRENGEERFRELMIYVIKKCGQDARFGAIKLNKTLYYADFFSYAKFGEPITGVPYMRLPQGPVPKRLVPVREEMVQRGEIQVFERVLFNGRRQTRYIALREPNLELFSARELALVDEVIEHLKFKTSIEVSDESHNRAWRMAAHKELIPYQAVYISDRPVRQSDIDRAAELRKQFNWDERRKTRTPEK